MQARSTERRSWLFLASAMCVLSGCEPRTNVYFARPWPADQVVIAVVTNAAGDPLDARPRLFEPGSAIRFDVASSEPFRVDVATFAADPELDRCGACFGGEGDPLPSAVGRWRSPLVSGEGELAFERDTTPTVLDLRYCCPAERMCTGVSTHALHIGPTYGDLVSVLALSFTRALFGGEARAMPPVRAATYGAIDDDTVTLFPPYEGMLDDTLAAFAWDGAERLWAITPTQLVQLDHDGIPTSSLAVGSSAGTHVGIERDTGRVLFTNGAGEVRTYDVATSTIVVAPGFPTAIENIGVWRSDRLMTLAKSGEVQVWVAGRWRREVDPSDVQPTRVVVGDDVMGTWGRHGGFLLRDEASAGTGAWRSLDRPFEPFALAGSPAGNGRILVTGDGGTAAMWTGSRWCLIETGTTNRLLAVSVSPDGRRGYAVGTNGGPGGEPALLIIDLPPP